MTVALATRGMIWWGPYRVVSCSRPITTAVIEVRPTLRAVREAPAQDPTPLVATASVVAPRLAPGDNSLTPQLVPPAITGAGVLAPVIVSAEEED